MKQLLNITSKDWEQIARYKRGLLVACSGGIDSAVLLHALCAYQSHNKSLSLSVCYINFHLREEACIKEERMVAELAKQYGISFFSYHPYPLFSKKSSFETWAREVKLDCFRLFQSRGYAIVLAHHLDDQYETILFRMIRGSQLWNLVGLKRWHQGLFRPFLEISKEKIRLFAQQNALLWQEDHSNCDVRLARNRLRILIIPEINHIHLKGREHVLALGKSAKIIRR